MPPFLLACANHNDKFLLSRYLKEKNIGSIVIFSSLFSGVAIPIVLFIQPDVYDVSLAQGTAVVATGMLSVFAVVCYLYALDLDEASFVTPFYQTVPIFAYFLGYFILGETITLAQGLGSFVIIIGALALSFEFGRRGMRFKRNVVSLMLAASFLSAINGVIFKLIAVDRGFWVSLFWGFVCGPGLRKCSAIIELSRSASWKCRTTDASVLGIEIASASPQAVLWHTKAARDPKPSGLCDELPAVRFRSSIVRRITS